MIVDSASGMPPESSPIPQYCGDTPGSLGTPIRYKAMDKKSKKRLEVLRKRLEKTQHQLAGAKQQTDEPEEIVNLESEIEKIKAEILELRNS